ncbi:putative nucleic acid-binding protein, contains PIN domain [Archaeoglobus sulfaticallidus PM70-1]|uniref:Putative nucleic acid-binding protein, contains PIN domain n=1 Tax=Archaeoglobus sulfaticallidus PM70-1 TaxID=387631 RepID=N0BLQ9_9EURY|nr:type II toxin-antitoxin system VapC family toxin [Archaeoglobus sulfaticallidus]AGK61170.1 putative nucleic acid-binding protein, contains PIN domain [Archaeoglobus sulfaticallidus PM70-1]
MREGGTRFLIDTNVFIAAVKKGWTKTTELVLHLLSNPEFILVANDVLLAEYEKYGKAFDAENFLEFLKLRVIIVNPSDEEIKACKEYFPENEVADAIHTATCLKTNAVLITNDKHFDPIKKVGLIEVWNISEAISRIL